MQAAAAAAASTGPVAPVLTFPGYKAPARGGEADDAPAQPAKPASAALNKLKAAASVAMMAAPKKGFVPSTPGTSKAAGGPAFLAAMDKSRLEAAGPETDFWTARALQALLGPTFFATSARVPPTVKGLMRVTYTQFVEILCCCAVLKRIVTHPALQVRGAGKPVVLTQLAAFADTRAPMSAIQRFARSESKIYASTAGAH